MRNSDLVALQLAVKYAPRIVLAEEQVDSANGSEDTTLCRMTGE
jgi:hypothetical protein